MIFIVVHSVHFSQNHPTTRFVLSNIALNPSHLNVYNVGIKDNTIVNH